LVQAFLKKWWVESDFKLIFKGLESQIIKKSFGGKNSQNLLRLSMPEED
jgi:hypothetical protein